METSKVSIVVTLRERFSCSAHTLQTLMDRTPAGVQVIYVGCGMPPATTCTLETMLSRTGGTFIHGPELLSQNAARNLGAKTARADAQYFVFLDNDVVVEPRWLEAMLNCALETGAGAVGPLMQEGDPSNPVIHMIGGVYREIDTPRGRVAFERHICGHRTFTELVSPPRRGPVDYIEGHCLLMSRAAFEACGGFDEQLITMWEYIDICLRIREVGFTAYVEPVARATYDIHMKVSVEDVPLYNKRWSVDDTRTTFEHYVAKRGIRPDCELVVYAQNFVREHRGRLRLFDQGADWARQAHGAPFPIPSAHEDLEDALNAGGYSISACNAADWLVRKLLPFVSNLSASQLASAQIGYRAAQSLIADGADIALVASTLLYPLLRSGLIPKDVAEALLEDGRRHWEFAGLATLLRSCFAMEKTLPAPLPPGFKDDPASALRPAIVLTALIGARGPHPGPHPFETILPILQKIGFSHLARAIPMNSKHAAVAAAE